MNLHKNADSYVRRWTENLSRISVHTQIEWIVGSCYVIAERIFAYGGRTDFTICVEDHSTHIRQLKQMCWLAQKDQLDLMEGTSVHAYLFSLSWMVCCDSVPPVSESFIAVGILYCIKWLLILLRFRVTTLLRRSYDRIIIYAVLGLWHGFSLNLIWFFLMLDMEIA